MKLYLSFELFSVLCLLTSQSDIDPATLRGHLEPLGLQGPVLSVDELSAFPDSKTFYNKYTRGSRPFLVKGGAKDSPGYSLWTDEYLMERQEAGSEVVTVESGKKENRTEPSSYYTMKEFLEVYRAKNIYMVAAVPKYIMQDVLLPYPLRCGGYQSQLVDTVMWFSSGGTKSVLHQDDVDNINCLFSGSKELHFIEYPKYKKRVHMDHGVNGYSSVDTDRVDLLKYPGFKAIEFHFVRMEAGDCLYIPYKWYHQVRSYDRNIAVNVWWEPLIEFNETDCVYPDDVGLPTIDKYRFQVLDKSNDEEETAPVSDLRDYFRDFMKEDVAMTYDELLGKMQKNKDLIRGGIQWVREMDEQVRKLFRVLDFNGDNIVTTSDIDELDDEVEDRLSAIRDDLEDVVDSQKMNIGPNKTGDSSRSVHADDELPNSTERDEL